MSPMKLLSVPRSVKYLVCALVCAELKVGKGFSNYRTCQNGESVDEWKV